MKNDNAHVIDSLNFGGEKKKIGRYSVDGFHEASNTVYELNGCLWHGFPHCFPKRNIKVPGRKVTVKEVYDETKQK